MLHVGWRALSALVLVSSFSLIGCGKLGGGADLPKPDGQAVSVTDAFDAVVMVSLPSGGICTGTFISEKAVLTAAHCATKSGRYQVIANHGTFSTYTVEKIGNADVEATDDLAILVFDTKVADRSKGQVYDLDSDVREGDVVHLVGNGCTSLKTKKGAGVTRYGYNTVARVGDFVELESPEKVESSSAAVSNNARFIGGYRNRAHTCFGDSGGPYLRKNGEAYKVAAVTHAGGQDGSTIYSDGTNVATNSNNRGFIASMNTKYDLGIQGL